MKTKWLFIAVVGLTFNNLHCFADALGNWYWRNPLPDGNPQPSYYTLNSAVFANGQFFAVGAGGIVANSSDGTNWSVGATAITNNLNGIAYLNGRFLAVGDGGAVETSTDGTNWVLRNSGTASSLSAAAYANGKYVAVGSGVVIVSSDTVSWSSSVSGLGGATGVAGGSAGFVAVTGSTQAYFSVSGSTWTSQVLTAAGTGFNGATLQNQIVTYANGAYLIGSFRFATSQSVDTFMFRSTDGSSWTTNFAGNLIKGSLTFFYSYFLTENGSYVAASYGNGHPFYQFSPDGINWATTNVSATIPAGTSGAYGNNTYAVTVQHDPGLIGSPPEILTSTDGVNWSKHQISPSPHVGPTPTITSIAYSNGVYVAATSGLFVRSTNELVYVNVSNSPSLSSVIALTNVFLGVGSAGAIYISGDGLTWTQRNSGTASNLHGVAGGGGLLVAVGDNGAIQTSPVGTIWTSRSSGTSLALYGVCYSNGLYVAVGQLGTVLTSPDGINWTGQDSGQLSNLVSVTYGSAGFMAVGPKGTLLTSPDGVNWTKQNTGTNANFESVCFGAGYYLVTGDNMVVLSSPDGVNWKQRNLGLTGGQNLYGCAFLNGRFDVVGTSGTIIESYQIDPLLDLQIRPGFGKYGFTMFATPGMTFRIQSCTNLSSPVWNDAATFNNAAAITLWTNSSAGYNQQFYRVISP